MRLISAFIVGLIFGVGIAISGMINPAKVLNFFDVAGTWDPSLMFVMGGALITTFIGYRLVLRRSAPLIEERFQLPASTAINARLIGGAAVFGLGWGIAGFCPGAALPALGSGKGEVFAFIGALLAGIWVARLIQTKQTDRSAAA
ncbi:hypothetical protein SAMN05443999_105208 [Roseovarius azorensis]|uniref:Sulphur transport domain-containing protein n=1 Tax=Roseovarius azorensis TaxID=1287727 RepID=A0A1H7Q8H2_9RHOB|nr:DUF6691 family protein [Roseovarius azorensis]SEL44390.1 hypothetical protein SAMN05443999_105208 [Roseovarius azorensis]